MKFIHLEDITIFLLMKRIIIKIQNNANGLSYCLIAIGMPSLPCVFIGYLEICKLICYIFYILDFAHVIICANGFSIN